MEELAASQERNRLARELHDTMAHSISGATVQLQGVQTLLGVDPDAAKAELKDARKQLKMGLAESRRAIATLRASPIEELGLRSALEKAARQLGERNQIDVQTALSLPVNLTHSQEQAVYRILTSAFNNIERHAAATKVLVKLEKEQSNLCFSVMDDGVGFDGQQGFSNGRYGLIGMKERAELINAKLEINSKIGIGTTVRLCLSEQS